MSGLEPIVHLVGDDEVEGDAKVLFDEVREVSGDVPKWMRVMANCDDTLLPFFGLFKSVMDDSPVDLGLKWKIAFVVSELNKCDYCVSVTRAKLGELGFGEDVLRSLDDHLSEGEAVAVEYARATALEAYKVDSGLIENMKEFYSDAEIVEITAVVGLFSFINRFNDALGVLPDVG